MNSQQKVNRLPETASLVDHIKLIGQLSSCVKREVKSAGFSELSTRTSSCLSSAIK